jgi:mRNA interferase HigB
LGVADSLYESTIRLMLQKSPYLAYSNWEILNSYLYSATPHFERISKTSLQNYRGNLCKTPKYQNQKPMHLISIRNLRKDAAHYSDVKNKIDSWNATVKQAEWQNLDEVRKIYRDAEAVGNFTVFNIKGNEYRLIVGINYEEQTIFYKYFLTHAEYDKEKWKNDTYF